MTNTKKGSVLVVDDNEEFLIALKLMLAPYFRTIDTEKNPALIQSYQNKHSYDLIILDMNFKAGINSGNEGIFWLNEIRKTDSDIPVVFITAYGDIELAVRSVKKGVVDFIQKSWDGQKILATILTAFELGNSKRQIKQLKSRQEHLSSALDDRYRLCIGPSKEMKEVFRIIEKVAGTEADVLLTGENGTGKEMIAREIHRQSDRRNELFVNVDIAALTPTLIESELFGHRKGAFTDAKNDREGRFELASGGTLFLDEIGNLDLSIQKKFLKALQDRAIYRVGETTPRALDIRLICATNLSLDEMVENGSFREDLLYRINTIQIELPPLRKRVEDIPILADFFLNKYSSKYNKGTMVLSSTAARELKKCLWPGNIRELEHSIEKAVILSEDTTIAAEAFIFENKGSLKTDDQSSFNLADNEKVLIQKALIQFNWNMSETARELGINRSTLYDKIRKYELS